MITPVDLVGFAAAAASLVAVSSTNMKVLRVALILGNLLFIAWGILGSLLPALVLHSVLLPINAWRLRHPVQSEPERPADPPDRHSPIK